MAPQIGSISHGTLNPVHLIPIFLETALDLGVDASDLWNVSDWMDALEREPDETPEDTNVTLESIVDTLAGLAPQYTYFGSHPGDGSDYGFWPDLDAVEEDRASGELKSFSDLSEVPEGFGEAFVVVNDHGNMSFYEPVTSHRLAWDCV